MKQIEAIIRPEKLADVTRALVDLGHGGLSVTPVRGRGAQGGIRQMWRCQEYVVDLLPKVRIVATVVDEDVDLVVSTIADVARTGRIGDGKIFVSSIEEALRVRTGEIGDSALIGGPDVRRVPNCSTLVDAEAP